MLRMMDLSSALVVLKMAGVFRSVTVVFWLHSRAWPALMSYVLSQEGSRAERNTLVRIRKNVEWGFIAIG